MIVLISTGMLHRPYPLRISNSCTAVTSLLSLAWDLCHSFLVLSAHDTDYDGVQHSPTSYFTCSSTLPAFQSLINLKYCLTTCPYQYNPTTVCTLHPLAQFHTVTHQPSTPPVVYKPLPSLIGGSCLISPFSTPSLLLAQAHALSS